MSAAKENPCRKFQANIFNKSKCQNCFKPRESHLLNDKDLTQVQTKEEPLPPASSQSIPTFYFPRGRPQGTVNVDAVIAKIERTFAQFPHERATMEDMGKVAKVFSSFGQTPRSVTAASYERFLRTCSSKTREKDKKQDAMCSRKSFIQMRKRIKESGKSKGVTYAAGIEKNQAQWEKDD
nr:uncharacterized protein LOC123283896 isoform X4 [Equus asinus]